MTKETYERLISLPTQKRQEVAHMAKLISDDRPTNTEIAKLMPIALQVVDGIDWTLKMVAGEVPRPKKSFRSFLQELQDEIDQEGQLNHE